jgi:hypothetical protein
VYKKGNGINRGQLVLVGEVVMRSMTHSINFTHQQQFPLVAADGHAAASTALHKHPQTYAACYQP